MEIAIGKIKISGAALITLAAAYFFDPQGLLPAVFVAAAIHELGHFAAIKLRGCRIAEMKLELWGLSMRCDGGMSYGTEIIVASAGPAASFLLAVAAALAGRFTGNQEAYLLAGLSLIFGVFNALPALPLDGGKIVYDATATLLGVDKAEQLTCLLTCAVILALLVTGTILLIKTKVNFTLLLAALWLLISYCKRCGISIKSKRKINGSETWIKN